MSDNQVSMSDVVKVTGKPEERYGGKTYAMH